VLIFYLCSPQKGLDMQNAAPYTPKNKIRIVTAASLFDGHDAAINIMRRIIQSTGAEVIHLGHDRSVEVATRSISSTCTIC
jgi:methylmalonyl-CoA mutase cobalamin-binding subunit